MKNNLFLLFVFPLIFSCEKDVAQDEELNSFSSSEKVDYTYEEFKRLPVCDKLKFGTWILREDSLYVNNNPDRSLDRCPSSGYFLWQPIYDSIRVFGDGELYFDGNPYSVDSSFRCSSGKFRTDFRYFRHCTKDCFAEGILINDTTIEVYAKSPVFDYIKNDGWGLWQVEMFGTLVLRSDHLIK